MEIGKGMYGLPQAGLWKHDTRPVTFTLVVGDFGIKFVGNEHIHHFIKVLKQYYTIEIDWTGLRYCGISLEWDYSKRILDINMHEYIAEQIIKYAHPKPKKPQHSPFKAPPPAFGRDSQKPTDHHIAPAVSKEAKLHSLQI
eukprot:1842761-Ditylum_brightwellii.AAC.1